MQGGNIGEGPGWGAVFLGAWLIASAVLGTVAAAVALVLRSRMPRRPPVAGAIALGYGLALPASAGAAILWLFTETWWPAAIAIALLLAVYAAVLRHRWR